MSIPPLVCSTPPPPEQCEDDKENEDYDFQYNLPPDEDDLNQEYSFCHYTSSHSYQSETVKIEKVPISSDNDNPSQISPTDNIVYDIQSYTKEADVIITNPEENLVEDLNLEITALDLQANNTNPIKCGNSDDGSSPVTSIQDQGGTNIPNLEEDMNENYDLSINPEVSAIHEDMKDSEIDIVVSTDILTSEALNFKEAISAEKESIPTDNITLSEPNDDLSIQPVPPVEEEFGDFNNFQCTSEHAIQIPTLEIENPWDSNPVDDQDFSDFKANFDEPEIPPFELTPGLDQTKSVILEKLPETLEDTKDDLDDDFGEFDDFKSSSNKKEINQTLKDTESSQYVLDIPLSRNEEQIVDNVNSVLTSIFIEDISEPETAFDVKLESLLGETWGHLVDTDIRQPYMVNWNNSLGQKIMLKALCIDSRNILFGPKWNYNAPRFAPNLGTVPLQPQKQNSTQQPLVGEDRTSQVSNTWTDPFTPQGQESCSAESEKPNVNIKSKDLDTFSSEVPANVTKIYSSTLSVQPLRQINLPDTHIFTPTDSETPRSKTIHYNNSPTSLIKSDLNIDKMQTVETSCKLEDDKKSPNMDNDSEYWDFQDFKQSSNANIGSKEIPETLPADTMPKNVTVPAGVYKTQILEPIKLEPTMPTLNWPDPGEVKETFLDFSDFVSSVPWNDKTTDSVSSKQDSTIHSQVQQTNPQNQSDDRKESLSNNYDVDDDFETFQSAPANVSNFIPQNTSQVIKQGIENLVIENTHNLKTSHLKSEKEIRPVQVDFPNKELFQVDKNSLSNEVPKPVRQQASQNSFEILKPAPSSSTLPRNQPNSTQILQPLSLESYSQINWPNPGIDLQDLSRFNPIESVHSLKSDTSTGGTSKVSTPVHSIVNNVNNDLTDDDIWGDFVSSAPKSQATPKTLPVFNDDDEWTDFVSSPNVKPPNGLNTISFNVQSNLGMQKSSIHSKYSNKDQNNIDIPTLNYITPKSNKSIYTDKHFQNL